MHKLLLKFFLVPMDPKLKKCINHLFLRINENKEKKLYLPKIFLVPDNLPKF